MKRIAAFLVIVGAAFMVEPAPAVEIGEAVTVTNDADAAWEGLSAEQQDALLRTGETGVWLDELVVEYRNALAEAPEGFLTILERGDDGQWSTHATCFEDMPCWDCSTMGNRTCGPLLPRTD